MKIKIPALLLVYLTIPLVASQSAQCTYELSPFGVYACRLINQNIQSESQLEGVGGDHLLRYGDNDVTSLLQRNSVIRIFPSFLVDRFVNLNLTWLENVQMQQFSSRIVNCARLGSVFLDNNRIPTLNSHNFFNCSQLTVLSITNSGIENIHEGAFAGLSRLNTLLLQGNNIANLLTNVFWPLQQLNVLQLQDNRISTWNVNMLATNRELTLLQLSGNQFRNLDVNAFAKTSNLLTLKIGNFIEEIPTFRNPGQLTHLSLTRNRIRNVAAASFQHLNTLQRLNLDFCEIETVNFAMGAENFLPDLRFLSLANNRIRNLQAHSFTMLIRLDNLILSNNQLQRINANVIRPIIQLRLLDLSRNQINRIERELFEGANNLTLRATGNICVSRDVTIINDAHFERDIVPILKDCLSSAITAKISVVIVPLALFLLFVLSTLSI